MKLHIKGKKTRPPAQDSKRAEPIINIIIIIIIIFIITISFLVD